ncbi:dihydrofolate reductase [Microbacterium sp.]|uniref:dihydrofolate reductase n=1 Tax=Microbacterium sp. TaxID=51671 RepID=UPI003A95D1F2
MRVGLIWAQARGGVIGAAGGMPWHVPEDLAHFKQLTMGRPVVMGRRTWESFPDRFRPLPGRRNIVITRDEGWQDAGADRAGSLDAALALASSGPGSDGSGSAGSMPADAGSPDLAASDVATWIIGGGQIFREAIARADEIGLGVLEVTELDLDVAGDTVAPSIAGWRAVASDPSPTTWHTSRTGIRYRFLRYTR